ncbi:hypothetical protein ACFFRR_002336 [Megaselia abdita]
MEQDKEIELLKSAIEVKDKMIEIEKRKAILEIQKIKNKNMLIFEENRELCTQITDLDSKSIKNQKDILFLRRNLNVQKDIIAEAQKKKVATVHQPDFDNLLKVNSNLNKRLSESRSISGSNTTKLRNIQQRLIDDNHNLKKAFQVRSEELSSVKKLFTPTQLFLLRNRRRNKIKCSWNHSEMSNAMSIYDCSSSAYKLLLLQGFPFPSVNTVLRWKLNLQLRKEKQNSTKVDEEEKDLQDQPITKVFKYDDDDDDDGSEGPQIEYTNANENIKMEVEFTEGSDALEFGEELLDIKPDINTLEINSSNEEVIIS